MSCETTIGRAPPVHEILSQIASTIEACAYSLAGHCDTAIVSQIILMGAQMDRLSRKLAQDAHIKDIRLEAVLLVNPALS